MIDIKIDDTLLQQRLRKIEEALGPAHLSRVLGDIGQGIIEQTRLGIGAGHDWQGRAFAPNTAVTLAKKRGSKPLIDTGIFLAHRHSFNGAAALMAAETTNSNTTATCASPCFNGAAALMAAETSQLSASLS